MSYRPPTLLLAALAACAHNHRAGPPTPDSAQVTAFCDARRRRIVAPDTALRAEVRR